MINLTNLINLKSRDTFDISKLLELEYTKCGVSEWLAQWYKKFKTISIQNCSFPTQLLHLNPDIPFTYEILPGADGVGGSVMSDGNELHIYHGNNKLTSTVGGDTGKLLLVNPNGNKETLTLNRIVDIHKNVTTITVTTLANDLVSKTTITKRQHQLVFKFEHNGQVTYTTIGGHK